MNKLQIVKMVNEVKDQVCEQFINNFANTTLKFQGANSNPFMGSCIIINHLLCETLKSKGLNAELVAGSATFGINHNNYGVIEYGYIGNMSTLTPDGSLAINNGFKGHAWVTIEELDLVIDLTLMHLKELAKLDNDNRGIIDKDYLLDQSELVLSTNQLIGRDKIIAGSIGYHYCENNEITAKALEQLAKILNLN